MRLSLAISSALLFGSYVTAIPVYGSGEASGSRSGNSNNLGVPAPHDAIYSPPDYPPPDHPPRYDPALGYSPDPAHQFQPPQQPGATHYSPPNYPPPGYPPLAHHNLGNSPDPAHQFQPSPPPPHQALRDSRGGLLGLPYVCTGCGHQSPGPESGPGPGMDHPVPSTHVNRNNPNPFARTGQGDTDSRVSSTRAQHTNAGPYAHTGHSGASGSGAGGSNGGAVGVPYATGDGTDGPSGGGPDANGKFRCPESGCAYSTRRKSDFQRHGKTVHSAGRNHACPDCDATFKERNKLTRHHQKQHPESVLPPNQRVRTSRVSKAPYTRVSHIGPDGSDAGPPSHIQCPMEGCSTSLYNDKSTVGRHLGEVHGINTKSYPCTTPGCDKTFKRKALLRDHQELTGHS